jgi:Domain of unknown function (DUF6265)
MRAAIAATILAGLLAGTVPEPPADLASPTLADLAFMAGCWRGPSGDGTTIEEYYTAPAENLMLGVSRYTKARRVTSYEFTTIALEGGEIVLTPRPAGQQPAPFRLTRLDSTGAVWENPAHDFPTLIAYRRGPGDSLVARIEGPGRNGKRSAEWRMAGVACGG